MRRADIRKRWVLLAVTVMVCAGSMPVYAVQEQGRQSRTDGVVMKVNFYALDRAKAGKGEYLGSAVLEDGGLSVDVDDAGLAERLNGPYTTIASEKKGDKIYERRVIYQPGTKEHLTALAAECYRFGYIGEIVNE